MNHHKIYAMHFSKIYDCLLAKAQRKQRTQAEVDEIICWLTGYSQHALIQMRHSQIDYQSFFADAPALNPHRKSITGTICGIRIEDIQEPLMQEIRYLDKLIDELAKGKAMKKILRQL